LERCFFLLRYEEKGEEKGERAMTVPQLPPFSSSITQEGFLPAEKKGGEGKKGRPLP